MLITHLTFITPLRVIHQLRERRVKYQVVLQKFGTEVRSLLLAWSYPWPSWLLIPTPCHFEITHVLDKSRHPSLLLLNYLGGLRRTNMHSTLADSFGATH